MTNSKSKIIFKDLPEDDPSQRSPDITLGKKILNWAPKYEFRKSLEKVINWYSNNMN